MSVLHVGLVPVKSNASTIAKLHIVLVVTGGDLQTKNVLRVRAETMVVSLLGLARVRLHLRAKYRT